MDGVLELIDENTLFETIRLGIREGARQIHFRPGCLPLCTGRDGSREIRFRQLTRDDTEAIAGMLLERAWVPERVAADPCDAAHPLALLCELPGEALLQVSFANDRGLAVAVEIALPLPAESELDLDSLC